MPQASSYPQRHVIRHEFAEYEESPNEDDNFVEPDSPNSDDAETFNDVAELPEDNEDEQQVHDSFWNRSSSYDEDLDDTEEDHDWREFNPREASTDEFENLRVAEKFNEASEETVRRMQSRTAGRNFSFSEQQALIDEDGTADQLPNLDLAGTFYED